MITFVNFVFSFKISLLKNEPKIDLHLVIAIGNEMSQNALSLD